MSGVRLRRMDATLTIGLSRRRDAILGVRPVDATSIDVSADERALRRAVGTPSMASALYIVIGNGQDETTPRLTVNR